MVMRFLDVVSFNTLWTLITFSFCPFIDCFGHATDQYKISTLPRTSSTAGSWPPPCNAPHRILFDGCHENFCHDHKIWQIICCNSQIHEISSDVCFHGMTLFGIGRRKQRDLWQSHIGLRPVAESQALAKGQCIHHGVLGGNGILPRWPACRPPPHDLPTVRSNLDLHYRTLQITHERSYAQSDHLCLVKCSIETSLVLWFSMGKPSISMIETWPIQPTVSPQALQRWSWCRSFQPPSWRNHRHLWVPRPCRPSSTLSKKGHLRTSIVRSWLSLQKYHGISLFFADYELLKGQEGCKMNWIFLDFSVALKILRHKHPDLKPWSKTQKHVARRGGKKKVCCDWSA